MTQVATKILKIPSSERTKDHKLLLVKATKKLGFFEKINSKPINIASKIHEKCCQHLNYASYKRGDVIFRQGDHPNKFYIVLKGHVQVLLLKDDETIRAESEALRQSDPDFFMMLLGQNSLKRKAEIAKKALMMEEIEKEKDQERKYDSPKKLDRNNSDSESFASDYSDLNLERRAFLVLLPRVTLLPKNQTSPVKKGSSNNLPQVHPQTVSKNSNRPISKQASSRQSQESR